MAKEPRKKYQIKIGLKGARPPIWRRLFIVDSVSLPKLHAVIQAVMGWHNCHLHQFIARGLYYGTPDPDDDFAETLDENKYRLNQFLKREKDTIVYEYDFGDSWEHQITLEKVLPFDPAETLPSCIKGKGACPPEDVGGIYAFQDFVAALNDPTHPEHDTYLEWVGSEYDPQFFNLDQINARLLWACR